jgi:cytochrome c peroxidase
MSLRNIELTAPYMHNGVFKTLREVVHFYNTRDILPECKAPADATNPGFGSDCWSRGEFHDTRNTSELGNLGLTAQDEADIVAYLKTFTDNYPSWGNRHGRRDRNVPKGTPSPYAY